jgi:hypothetical protein
MKPISIIILIFLTSFISCNYSNNEKLSKNNSFKSVDGPYIFDLKDSIKVVNVNQINNSSYKIITKYEKKDKNRIFVCEVDNLDADEFSFSLIQDYKIPAGVYRQNEKIFVTSDIEGNFNAFYSMLVGNNIIDKNFNWTFDKGCLVICGDMFDRGKDVIPCLWLLYSLEKKAELFGGKVHFLLGNHDTMNLLLDIRYVEKKYLQLAKVLFEETDDKKAYQKLMSTNNELVKWVSSKNAVEKIGKSLFLHGGISPEVVDALFSIDEINQTVRENIQEQIINRFESNEKANLIMGRKGPIWYRGLVKDYKEYYKKVTMTQLDMILEYYDVNRIIIGHTIVSDQITTDFNNKIIRIGTKHATKKFSGETEGLLIDGMNYWRVSDTSEKNLLFVEK